MSKIHVGFDLDPALAKKVIDFVEKNDSGEEEDKPKKKDVSSLLGKKKEDEEEEVTVEMLQAAVLKKAEDNDGDVEEIEKLLKKHKAPEGVSSLPKSKYKAFLKDLKEL